MIIGIAQNKFLFIEVPLKKEITIFKKSEKREL